MLVGMSLRGRMADMVLSVHCRKLKGDGSGTVEEREQHQRKLLKGDCGVALSVSIGSARSAAAGT